MSKYTPVQAVDFIFALFDKHAHEDYIGEPISQLEHALQTAALAKIAGGNDDLIVASLLHDIGHFNHGNADFAEQMAGFGTVRHEQIGARLTRELGFSVDVGELILGHVEAKRFLVFKHPDYSKKLSVASLETLKHQGGPMLADEALAFESNPLFKDKLRLRAWDDQAKLENHPVPTLESYRTLLLSSLMTERENTVSTND
jgi:predicted HD phosphohydrolase